MISPSPFGKVVRYTPSNARHYLTDEHMLREARTNPFSQKTNIDHAMTATITMTNHQPPNRPPLHTASTMTNLRVLFHIDRDLPVPLTGLMSTRSRRCRRSDPCIDPPCPPCRCPMPVSTSTPSSLTPSPSSFSGPMPIRLSLIAVAHFSAVSASDTSHVWWAAFRFFLRQSLNGTENDERARSI